MNHFRLIILFLAALSCSCANDMAIVHKFIDVEVEPDMIGEHMEVLQSDSARLQMRMITPLMKQFSSATEQRDEYPEGLHVWFYDANGDFAGEVTANWAMFYKTEELWEARHNVKLTGADGSILETEQFFWDRRKEIVYSDKFTKVTDEAGSIVVGVSFTANQDFTNFKLLEARATIIMTEEVDNDSENEDENED